MSRRKQLRPQHLRSGETDDPENTITSTTITPQTASVDGLNEGAASSTYQQPDTQPDTQQAVSEILVNQKSVRRSSFETKNHKTNQAETLELESHNPFEDDLTDQKGGVNQRNHCEKILQNPPECRAGDLSDCGDGRPTHNSCRLPGVPGNAWEGDTTVTTTSRFHQDSTPCFQPQSSLPTKTTSLHCDTNNDGERQWEFHHQTTENFEPGQGIRKHRNEQAKLPYSVLPEQQQLGTIFVNSASRHRASGNTEGRSSNTCASPPPPPQKDQQLSSVDVASGRGSSRKLSPREPGLGVQAPQTTQHHHASQSHGHSEEVCDSMKVSPSSSARQHSPATPGTARHLQSPWNTSELTTNSADDYCIPLVGDLNDRRYLSAKLLEKNEIIKRIRRHSALASLSSSSEDVSAGLVPGAQISASGSRRTRTYSERVTSKQESSASQLSINTSLVSGSPVFSGQPLASPLGQQFQWVQPVTPTLQTHSPGGGSDVSSVSGSSVLPRYTCQVCGVVLRSLPELGMHIQEHAADRLYKCELCEKSFEKRSELERHQFTDHRLQPTLAANANHGGGSGERNSASDSGSRQEGGDKNRFNFHSPWEEFASRQRRDSTQNASEHAAAASAASAAAGNSSRGPKEKPMTTRWNGETPLTNHDPNTATASQSLKIKTEQRVSSAHYNINNNGRSTATSAKATPSGEMDLNQSYRSVHSLDSNLDSSVGSDRGLNSSGDTSYHSALQSPVDDSAALAMATREPGETTGMSGSLKRELSASFGAELFSKGYNGMSEKHALDGLKTLAAKNFAYPPSLPGFSNTFRHPSGPWVTMTKYGQVNGYMPAGVAPCVVSPGYSTQTSAVATPTSSSSNNSSAMSFRGTLGKQTDSGLACSYCGKVCPRPSILKRHMMMHTGERPFECKVCGQRFRAKGSMLFHQKLRHNMDVKLNKALEERYLQIVSNQRQKQMREERKKAALSTKDSAAWFQHEMQSWMLQNHLQNRVMVGMATESDGGGGGAENSGVKTGEDNESPKTSCTGKYEVGVESVEESRVMDYSGKSTYNAEPQTQQLSSSSGSRGDNTIIIEDIDQEELSEKPVASANLEKMMSVRVKSEMPCSQSQPADVNGNIDTSGAIENMGFEVDESDSKTAGTSVHKDETSQEAPLINGGKSELGTDIRSAVQMDLNNVENVNRIREMMFTTELQAQQQVEGFDDNCNLKENLDKLIMKAFGKLGLDNYNSGENSPVDGNGRDGQPSQNAFQQGTSSASSTSVSPHGHMTTGGGGGDVDDFTIDYPSVFPGLKHQMKVRNETVIVTRLDGISSGSGEKVSLYKCYLCGRIFRQLSLLQCHLSTHFEKQVTFYECLCCEAHFKFKTQLLQHMKLVHDVNYALNETEIPDAATVTMSVLGDPSAEDTGSGANLLQSHQLAEGHQSEGDLSSVHDQDTEAYPEDVGQDSEVYLDQHMSTTPQSPTPAAFSQHQHKGKTHYSGITVKKINGLYVCRFCRKTFERSFSLIRHERMHTGYKPCVCRYCGRGFSEPRNLRHHTMRYHGKYVAAHTKSGVGAKQRIGRIGRSISYTDGSKVSSYQQLDVVNYSHLNTQEESDRLGITSPAAHDKFVMDTDGNKTTRKEELESPQNHESGSLMEETSSSKTVDTSSEIAANAIREKEMLGDDVTVVIPSDPPLDVLRERNQDTPRSMNSENTTWSNISEVDSDIQGAEIISAPVRSLIGASFKPKRRPSYPGGAAETLTTSKMRAESPTGQVSGEGGTNRVPTPCERQQDHIQEGGECVVRELRSPTEHRLTEDTKSTIVITPDTPTPSSSSGGTYTSTPQGAAPAGMTPFGPLSVSTFLNPAGLPGLIPSPLMSPAHQAMLFSQAGLTSPTVMGGVLPFMSQFHSTPSCLGGASAAAGAGGGGSSKEGGVASESQCAAGSYTGVQKMEEMSRAEYLNQMKGSSLSRTHSRNPIKREEACKPTVLSDGRTVYRCSYCNKDFATYSDINRHMDFHEDIRPYKCKYCDYYARTNSQLKVHMMRHQGIREFHCKLCNYKGVTQSDLNRHMKSQIHMMKAQNECRQCGEGFVSHKNLERHVEEKHLTKTQATGGATSSGASRSATMSSSSSGSVSGGTGQINPINIVGFQAPLPR